MGLNNRIVIGFVGLQTGDEGKGIREGFYVQKAVEIAPPLEDVYQTATIRWQGGANAGHTAVMNGEEYKLHLVNTGALIPGTFNLTGAGVYVIPQMMAAEISNLQRRGIDISPKNFGIASNAHVTLQFHIDEDSKDFHRAGHTSTGKGIRQTARDKFDRVGMRLEEFLDEKTFIELMGDRFQLGVPVKTNNGVERLDPITFSSIYDESREYISPFSVLQSEVLKKHGTKFLIGEGAQGFRLDVDHGYYPGITSSNPAIFPFRHDIIAGVVKLYESSVGSNRPFVSQIQDKAFESRLREYFGERGTTTGLPRDLGWFDAVAVKHAIDTTETDYLIGTCGDRLECLHEYGETVKLVTAYKINGREFTEWDKSFHNRRILNTAEPVFEEFAPWDKFHFDGVLTPNAQRYVDRIQELTGKEFALLGTGPGINDVIEIKDILDN